MPASARELLIEEVQEQARADLAELLADLAGLADLEARWDSYGARPYVSADHEARSVETRRQLREEVRRERARLGIR